MAAFDLALSCVRDGSHDHLLPSRINQLARDRGHFFRETRLTPGNTLQLFARQIACGNIACSAVHHLSDAAFSDSAWCQARQRLSVELIEQVHRQFVDDTRRELDQADDAGEGDYRWRGHRLHVVDGSTDSMPDTPALRDHYGVPAPSGPGLGFPTAHLMLLFDHRSGLLIDCHDAHVNTHDASVVSKVHPHLEAGDLLLGDDAFGSYTHLALLLQANLHAIMPVHHLRIVDFTPGRVHVPPKKKGAGKNHGRHRGKPRSRQVKTLSEKDQLVEYFKPPRQPDWMSHQQWMALPESIVVREIRRTIKRHGFRPITVTIATTLLDPESYPADELIELRLTRWMIETNLRHLKITLGMDILKCKTVDGVRKERMMFLLVYNQLRRVMLQSARSQRVNVNRLSFADTLAWLRHGDISVLPRPKINPPRPGRLEPRVLKRAKKQFPYLTMPRDKLKAQLRALHCDIA
jgi:Transposase DDE domain